MRLVAQTVAQGPEDPRLADARFSRQEHDLALARFCLQPAVEQQRHLTVAPDEWRQARGVLRLEAAFRRHFSDDPPDLHRLGEALDVMDPVIGAFKQVADETTRGRRNHHGIRVGQRLQARRQVRRLPDRRFLQGGAVTDQIAHDH